MNEIDSDADTNMPDEGVDHEHGCRFEIMCQLCGKPLEVGAIPENGQHVKCAHCGGKFSYSGNVEKLKEITRKDLAIALCECRKNPDDNHFYSAAPEGARLFIGLLFYGKHFKERVDANALVDAFSEIETELKAKDIAYLKRFETNAEMLDYFDSLLAVRNEMGDIAEEARHTIRAKRIATLKSPTLGIIRPNPNSIQESRVPGMDNSSVVARTIPQTSAPTKRQNNPFKPSAQRESAKSANRRMELKRMTRDFITCACAAVAVAILGFVLWSRIPKPLHKQQQETQAINMNITNEKISNENKVVNNSAIASANDFGPPLNQNPIHASSAIPVQSANITARAATEGCNINQVTISTPQTNNDQAVVLSAPSKPTYDSSYDNIVQNIKGSLLLLWNDKHPPYVSANEKFVCIVNDEVERFALYEIEGFGSSAPKAFRMQQGKGRTSSSYTELECFAKTNGCLYSYKGVVYLRRPSSTNSSKTIKFPVPEEDQFLVYGKEMSGKMFDIIHGLALNGNNLKYDVIFNWRRPGEIKTQPQKLITVSFMEPIRRNLFYGIVEDGLMEKAKAQASENVRRKNRPPKFNPRIVKDDDPHIPASGIRYKDVTGVEHIPTEFRFLQPTEYHGVHFWGGENGYRKCQCNACKKLREYTQKKEQYEKLSAEADRQNAQLEMYEEKVRRLVEEEVARISISKREVNRELANSRVQFLEM